MDQDVVEYPADGVFAPVVAVDAVNLSVPGMLLSVAVVVYFLPPVAVHFSSVADTVVHFSSLVDAVHFSDTADAAVCLSPPGVHFSLLAAVHFSDIAEHFSPPVVVVAVVVAVVAVAAVVHQR